MKLNMRDQKGFSLVLTLLLFSASFMGFISLVNATGSHARIQSNTLQSSQAFYLAEAAVEAAIAEIRDDFNTFPVEGDGGENGVNGIIILGQGEYYFNVAQDLSNPNVRTITGYGAVPDFANAQEIRVVEQSIVGTPASMPAIFDKAIYSFDDIDINGGSHTVNGDIFSGDDIDCSPSSCPGVTGAKEEMDDDDYPLVNLPFNGLKSMAQDQGYYFTETPDIADLPTDFYFEEPFAGNPGVPNVVYIEGDLVVNGNESVGGFFVVAGDDPDNLTEGGSATLNGTAQVDGVIFAADTFTKNGGGNVVNVTGGVVSWEDSTLNGKTDIQYNPEYMNIIEEMEVEEFSLAVQSWNEK